MSNNVKNFWLIRGVSGAGKSTVADLLRMYLPDGVNTEADKFRYIDGVYAYRDVPNHYAHGNCKREVRQWLEEGMSNIVVSNTSCRRKDVNMYKNMAEKYGYRFISIVVENYHESGNTHGVTDEVLEQMEGQLRESIKLR